MNEFYKTLTFNKIFWIFFIGCFFGVVIETIWCILRNKHYESRTGLIYGPFNLVYGFGAVITTFSLSWLTGQRDLYVFLLGTLVGGVYEYLCSVIQEKTLGTVSWHYVNLPMSIKGRINLLYCIFWGLLGLLWTKDICPGILKLINLIPHNIENILLPCCVVFMIINTIMSASVIYRMKKRMDEVKASNKFWKYIDRHYPDEKVRKIYPNMVFDLSTLKEN